MGEERLIELADDVDSIAAELQQEITDLMDFCEHKYFMTEREDEIAHTLEDAVHSAHKLARKLRKTADLIAN